MKTSIKLAVLAFGAASLAAVMISPASAQVAGGSNCSNFRDSIRDQQCFTRTPDQLQDKEGDLKRDSGGGVHSIAGTGIHVTPSARGYISGVPMPAAHVDYNSIGTHVQLNTIGTRPGNGGSGGKQSAN
jgi:hypothetical protein